MNGDAHWNDESSSRTPGFSGGVLPELDLKNIFDGDGRRKVVEQVAGEGDKKII